MSSPPLRCLSPLVDDRGLIGPQMTTDTVLQGVLRHDRLIIIAALSLLTVLAWADLAMRRQTG